MQPDPTVTTVAVYFYVYEYYAALNPIGARGCKILAKVSLPLLKWLNVSDDVVMQSSARLEARERSVCPKLSGLNCKLFTYVSVNLNGRSQQS